MANEWDACELHEWGYDLPSFEDQKIEEETQNDDYVPESAPAITVKGDLYILGDHRLLCGDSTMIDDVEKLMDGEKADMVFTDPPYGMNYNPYSDESRDMGKTYNGANRKKSKTNAKIIGDDEYFDPSFLMEYFNYCDEQFWWGCDYYIDNIPAFGKKGSIQVWNKRYGIEDVEFNTSHYELCFSKKKHLKRIFNIKWFGIQGTEKQDVKNRVHPTQKPIQLAEVFIKEWGKDRHLIADPFLGSGSTLIACEKTNRKCYGMELDEKVLRCYC